MTTDSSASDGLLPQQERGGYAGRVMGGYRLSFEIASGGMASVYLAHKIGLAGVTHVAAVKVVHPHLSQNPDFVEMFLDEARIATRISHANVCRTYDFGRAEGTYFLVMEYVLGETWSALLKSLAQDGTRQPDELPLLTSAILAKVAQGLHAAHEATDGRGNLLNVVHRDVSPQNAMVTYDGDVRVLDFGVATAADRVHSTRAGAIKGRIRYMSPEQMEGRAIDRRSDIWSLGVMLWEAVARRRLFSGETDLAVMRAVTSDPIPELHASSVQRVPEELVAIAHKALQRDVDERYATAEDMATELARYVAAAGPVTTRELSSAMHHAFPNLHDRKQALLAAATREAEDRTPMSPIELPGVGPGDVAHGSYPPAAEGPTSGVHANLHGQRHPTGSQPISHSQPVAVTTGAHPIPASNANVRSYVLVIATAALTALMSFGLFALLADEPPPTPSRSSEGAPAPEGREPAQAPIDDAREQPLSAEDVEGTPKAARSGQERRPTGAEEPATTGERGAAGEAPVTRSRRARRRGKGRLNLASPGCWAEVFLGDRRLGNCPGSFELRAGTHTLTLKINGERVRRRRVTVRAGETQRLRIPCGK